MTETAKPSRDFYFLSWVCQSPRIKLVSPLSLQNMSHCILIELQVREMVTTIRVLSIVEINEIQVVVWCDQTFPD